MCLFGHDPKFWVPASWLRSKGYCSECRRLRNRLDLVVRVLVGKPQSPQLP
jgi:hypothetical protein